MMIEDTAIQNESKNINIKKKKIFREIPVDSSSYQQSSEIERVLGGC